MGKEDIVDRWTEYIGELYGGEKLTPDTENCDGPPILEDEIIDTIKAHKERKSDCA